MHEVEVRPTRHPVEDREIARVLNGVPSHVRDFQSTGEAANHARNDVQPLALAELLALGKEKLIAEADAEKRAPLVEGGPERLEKPSRLEIGHGVVEGAIAGQDEGAGILDHARILRHDRPHAEPAERVLDAAQISSPVVDDRDHSGCPTPVLVRGRLASSPLTGSSGRPADRRGFTSSLSWKALRRCEG